MRTKKFWLKIACSRSISCRKILEPVFCKPLIGNFGGLRLIFSSSSLSLPFISVPFLFFFRLLYFSFHLDKTSIVLSFFLMSERNFLFFYEKKSLLLEVLHNSITEQTRLKIQCGEAKNSTFQSEKFEAYRPSECVRTFSFIRSLNTKMFNRCTCKKSTI